MTTRIETTVDNAPKLLAWINAGRGLALWQSADLGNPSQTWTTPAKAQDGAEMTKQHWSMEDKPAFVTYSADDVDVFVDREVKRFRVGVKRSYGFRFECTSAASRKIRAEVAKHGDGAYHVFDYETQEAVIMVPESKVSLTDWAKANPQ
jgi:hypothetical protein